MIKERVNEIDLLRFFAVMAVLIFHYAFRGHAADSLSSMPYPLLAEPAKYGYLGVELFFMISGFVILMTAASGDLRGFVVSRLVRLYPAFWACCTLTFVVIMVAGAPRFQATAGQYLLNMTMLSGFFGVASIDNAYWSLFVEIQFYAMVAIILLLGRIHQSQTLLAIWLAACIALQFIPVGRLRMVLMADHAAFFVAGASFFLIRSRGVSPMRLTMVALSWLLGTWQAIQALAQMREHYHVPMRADVVAAIILVFFILFLLLSTRRLNVIGRRRWLLAGALTYPLYLLHQNIGFIIFNLTFPGMNAHLLFWGTVLLALCAAYAVHVLIENKLAGRLKNAINAVLDRLAALHSSSVRR